MAHSSISEYEPAGVSIGAVGLDDLRPIETTIQADHDFIAVRMSIGSLQQHINRLRAEGNSEVSLSVPRYALRNLPQPDTYEDIQEPYSFFHEIITVDPEERHVYFDGRRMNMTALEYKLTAYLGKNPGKVHTQQEIFEDVWQLPGIGSLQTIRAHVFRLRTKLPPESIETRVGIGYLAVK